MDSRLRFFALLNSAWLAACAAPPDVQIPSSGAEEPAAAPRAEGYDSREPEAVPDGRISAREIAALQERAEHDARAREHAQAPLDVLVVDDDVSNLELAATILKGYGHRVSVARSGAEAVEMLRGGKGNPDLILLDIAMPRMNGLETTRVIRKLGIRTAILCVSGKVGYGYQREVMLAGGDGYLAKPYRVGHLLNAMSGAIAHRSNLYPFEKR